MILLVFRIKLKLSPQVFGGIIVHGFGSPTNEAKKMPPITHYDVFIIISGRLTWWRVALDRSTKAPDEIFVARYVMDKETASLLGI